MLGGVVFGAVAPAFGQAFAAVQLLAEIDGAAGGQHGLVATAVLAHAHGLCLHLQAALFDLHVAAEHGHLVFLVERALGGFNRNGLVAVAVERVCGLQAACGQDGGQKYGFIKILHKSGLSLVRAGSVARFDNRRSCLARCLGCCRIGSGRRRAFRRFCARCPR